MLIGPSARSPSRPASRGLQPRSKYGDADAGSHCCNARPHTAAAALLLGPQLQSRAIGALDGCAARSTTAGAQVRYSHVYCGALVVHYRAVNVLKLD